MPSRSSAKKSTASSLDDFRKLSLPSIRSVVLNGFSLYQRHKVVSVAVGSGATCFAGANGIGKSTLLAAILFGLTGSVPVPAGGRDAEDLNEYRKRSIAFTEPYFTGRIAEHDRVGASVELEFGLQGQVIKLKRPVFSPGLEVFTVSLDGPSKRPVIRNSRSMTDEQRDYAYETWLATQTGLQSFNQFIFLNHFVLMFDESRHLLFWDSRATEQALFLIFGGNEEAISADKLRRDMERADSRARNIQFQIAGSEKRIKELRAALGFEADEDEVDTVLLDQIESLVESEAARLRKLDLLNDQLSDNSLQLADRAASLVSLRDEYSKRFEELVVSRANPEDHPLIRAALEEKRCGICGAAGPDLSSHIGRTLHARHCPLCNTALDLVGSLHGYEDLVAIDERITTAQERLSEANSERKRLAEEKALASGQLEQVQASLRRIERSNRALVSHARNRDAVTDADRGRIALDALIADVGKLRNNKTAALNERDKKKRDLQVLQGRLAKRYSLAEEHFVPAFRSLAERFLGIALTVRLQGSAGKLGLLIEVANTARREKYQLSESQRFFVDIALRMALAQFASSPHAAAPLFVDTPEGALDIAYESQAGTMFADFVKSGHQLILTANVNASELVLQLARRCGKRLFRLEKMTDWVRLSDVQRANSSLFESSFKQINAALSARRG